LFIVGYFIIAFRNPLILEKPIRLFRPDIEIIDTTGQDHIFSGFDYGYIVDVTLNNKGASGTVLVRVELSQGAEKWVKEQAVSIGHAETKKVTFEFREPKFELLGSNKTYYKVRVME